MVSLGRLAEASAWRVKADRGVVRRSATSSSVTLPRPGADRRCHYVAKERKISILSVVLIFADGLSPAFLF